MNDNKQQRLDKLTAEYNDLNGKISRLDAFLNRLDFETTVPDSEEQMLMQHQLNAMRSYRTNLKERIQLLQAQIKRDIDKPCRQVCGDGIATQQYHCGQDASCPVGGGSAAVNEIPDSIKSLEGMQVIKVCGPKCKDCPCGDGPREYPSGHDMSSCVKVELVGGYMLCLAPLPNSIVTE